MPRPIAAKRLYDILERVDAERSVSVEALAESFGVSRETIRRDLKTLAAQGRLDVVHGGALKRGVGEPPYAERVRENAAGKTAIGRAAAALVEPGMVVLLDSGATTHAVAVALAASPPKDVSVCATSLVDALLLSRAGLKVTVLGGEVDPDDGATVGVDVIAALARHRVDLVFVGVGGITMEGDVTVFSRLAAETRSVMIDVARQSYLIADHGKFGRAGPARITWTRAPSGVIVDTPPPRQMKASLAAQQIPCIVAKSA
ncbi:DeoR/GlpR family DNA-binding transcription regulator [Methylopila sp. Yamaguchi]|uniref:DeoR/GlpR family DNA-binding transcription regulator n=1 Tax=Methylopila sp. Yamaguchi TaxID=1437817 RepID=UPI000CCC131E|nr:DeoR/GlpR family DNA-binding transcription regulator [Methylopila sp. Yamaguchi]